MESGLEDKVSFVRLKTVKALADTEEKGYFEGSLSWEPGSEDVVGYLVCYGTRAGEYPHCRDVGNRTEFHLDGLKLSKDETYYFVIKAYNNTGKSLSSQEIVVSQTDVAAKLQQMIETEDNDVVKKEAEKTFEKMIKKEGP